MVHRKFWVEAINEGWKRKSVVWLSGVRRVGKTCLALSLPGVEYFDCELPRVRRMMEDPEPFLSGFGETTVVLDEIHRLGNPSEVLKIAADHFPEARVLAIGSSTLAASTRFRDTLSGRKANVWLTPMIQADLAAFGNPDLHHRFLAGGLPPFFMEQQPEEKAFQEWMDAYWARDIQELFRVQRRYSFQRFCELAMAHSGGIFEASRYARPCEASRQTITNYLNVLEATYVVQIVRPFSSHRPTEIVSAPKVYGFDTGFVCCHRGITGLRPTDLDFLWEHFVLNEIQVRLQSREIRYWRDKRGHEVDFVLAGRLRSQPAIVECKWSASDVDPRNMKAFRRVYPEGPNFVVAADVDRAFNRRYGDLEVRFLGLAGLVNEITASKPR